MGYQETWFCLQPQHRFDEMIHACEKQRGSGVYRQLGTAPSSVITLKEQFGALAPGTKVLWVTGERCFQSAELICGQKFERRARAGKAKLQIVPVEQVLEGPEDPRLNGIQFNSISASENASMRRQSYFAYTQGLHRRVRDR